MTTTGDYATIVVGTDGSALAVPVMMRAARLAVVDGADLVIVSAWSGLTSKDDTHGPLSTASTAVVTALPDRTAASAALVEAAGVATRIGATVTASLLVDGDPAAALLDTAAGRGAGLIVMGAHSRPGLVERLLGDVASEVVRKALCDVLIVRPPDALGRADADEAASGAD